MSLSSTASQGVPERSVLVIGVGGLGCPATLALARAGIRRLTLADPDVVERSNLPRQLWHGQADLGRAKVDSAAEKLRAAVPGIELRTLRERLAGARLRAVMAGHDVVLDCVDGVETKFELSDAAVQTGVPLVHAGVLRLEGQVMRVRPAGPCLRCLFEGPPPPELAQSCSQTGVLGSVAGAVAAIQARSALELLARLDPGGRGGIPIEPDAEPFWQLDGRTSTTRVRRVRRAPDCGCAAAGAGRAEGGAA